MTLCHITFQPCGMDHLFLYYAFTGKIIRQDFRLQRNKVNKSTHVISYVCSPYSSLPLGKMTFIGIEVKFC